MFLRWAAATGKKNGLDIEHCANNVCISVNDQGTMPGRWETPVAKKLRMGGKKGDPCLIEPKAEHLALKQRLDRQVL